MSGPPTVITEKAPTRQARTSKFDTKSSPEPLQQRARPDLVRAPRCPSSRWSSRPSAATRASRHDVDGALLELAQKALGPRRHLNPAAFAPVLGGSFRLCVNSEDEQPNVTRTGFAARLRAPLACGAVQGGSLPVHTSVRARTGRGARRAARRGSRARCVHEGGTEGGVWLPRAPQVLNLAPSLAVARPHHVLSRGTICQGAAQRVLPRPREARHFLAVVRTARTVGRRDA